MIKETAGIINETKKMLDPGKEEDRRRAMKLRKRTKKKNRKQRDKHSSTDYDKIFDASSPAADCDQQATSTKDSEQQTPARSNNQQGISTNEIEQQISLSNNSRLLHENEIPSTKDTIDYVTAPIDLSSVDCYGQDIVQQFSDIFQHFELLGKNNYSNSDNNSKNNRKRKAQIQTPSPIESKHSKSNDDHNTETPSRLTESSLSRKKLKATQRYTLDELKTLATVPEVVEVWDTSAMDPLLLVDLKSYRNTVPVPIHWRQQQKYLYRHRSEEKPPFVLPDFIKNTGVMEARDNLKKQQERKRQKTKSRERRNPKLGKTDLDYQDLHDAFFLHQTEPHLTPHGDLYFERKETISKLKKKTPGELSDELKEALGILSTPLAPPPWLLQMQRYGPPPNYPHLKIPGLNAPIPVGAQWGLQKDGWGLVPVDGFNRPLYGDVLKNDHQSNQAILMTTETDNFDRTLWGELEDEQGIIGDNENDSSDNDNDINNTDIPTTTDQPISVFDTEEVKPINMNVELELKTGKRKRRFQPEDNQGGNNQDSSKLPKLYDIIPTKTTASTVGWMGTQYTYDLSSASSTNGHRITGSTLNHIGHTWNKPQDVTVSLDPNALGDYETAVQDVYQKVQEERMPKGVGDQELKNMYTDHAKRQAKKKRQMDIRNADKKKDFRF